MDSEVWLSTPVAILGVTTFLALGILLFFFPNHVLSYQERMGQGSLLRPITEHIQRLRGGKSSTVRDFRIIAAICVAVAVLIMSQLVVSVR